VRPTIDARPPIGWPRLADRLMAPMAASMTRKKNLEFLANLKRVLEAADNPQHGDAEAHGAGIA